MWPRLPGPVYRRQRGETNRESFRALLRAGQIHAVLAFEGREPVGWCSFGPRGSFPRINARRELASDYDAGTWAIVCFFIPSRFRGMGIATALADAAAKRCFELGAREVEGYPVEPSGPEPRSRTPRPGLACRRSLLQTDSAVSNAAPVSGRSIFGAGGAADSAAVPVWRSAPRARVRILPVHPRGGEE